MVVAFMILILLITIKVFSGYLKYLKKENQECNLENEILTKTVVKLREEIKKKNQKMINLEKKNKEILIEKDLTIKELKVKVRLLQSDRKNRKS